MELTKFARAPEFLDNLVTAPFEVAGGSVDITVNIDAFCDAFWRRASQIVKEHSQPKANPEKKAPTRAKSKSKKPAIEEVIETLSASTAEPFELLALGDETERRIFTDMLLTPGIEGQSPVLADWGIKVDGVSVKPSREALMSIPTSGVRELWFFCRRQAETVKKLGRGAVRTPQTTDGIIEDGSSTPD